MILDKYFVDPYLTKLAISWQIIADSSTSFEGILLLLGKKICLFRKVHKYKGYDLIIDEQLSLSQPMSHTVYLLFFGMKNGTICGNIKTIV